MNTIEEFLNYFEQHKNFFCAWGDYVTKKIENELTTQITPLKISEFLKIEAKPRIKEIESARAKIYRKNYTNPKVEMTDLVGVRFVVLISQQIDIISNIIEKELTWNAVVSNDFCKDRELNPTVFDYQSKHYEVRPNKNIFIKYNDKKIEISKDICCEVQIRSLLQHAYAELVHDNLYKPAGKVPNEAKREVAKSMALMETTDDLFTHTLTLLQKHNTPINNLYENLSNLYIDIFITDSNFDKKTNLMILEVFSNYISESIIDQIQNLLKKKKFIENKIRTQIENSYLFQQPIILFIYWLVSSNPTAITKNIWPLPAFQQDLSYVFSDLDKGPLPE